MFSGFSGKKKAIQNLESYQKKLDNEMEARLVSPNTSKTRKARKPGVSGTTMKNRSRVDDYTEEERRAKDRAERARAANEKVRRETTSKARKHAAEKAEELDRLLEREKLAQEDAAQQAEEARKRAAEELAMLLELDEELALEEARKHAAENADDLEILSGLEQELAREEDIRDKELRNAFAEDEQRAANQEAELQSAFAEEEQRNEDQDAELQSAFAADEQRDIYQGEELPKALNVPDSLLQTLKTLLSRPLSDLQTHKLVENIRLLDRKRLQMHALRQKLTTKKSRLELILLNLERNRGRTPPEIRLKRKVNAEKLKTQTATELGKLMLLINSYNNVHDKYTEEQKRRLSGGTRIRRRKNKKHKKTLRLKKRKNH
uniref:Uncharacterized protein n=1 Tax=viral metagenome TaxID=1070528 RepID=A0A6C0DWH8_9ZZZZ